MRKVCFTIACLVFAISCSNKSVRPIPEDIEGMNVTSIKGEADLNYGLNELRLMKERRKILMAGSGPAKKGIYDYQEGMTSRELISLAGGDVNCTAGNIVNVKRIVENNFIAIGEVSLDDQVKPGDTVYLNCAENSNTYREEVIELSEAYFQNILIGNEELAYAAIGDSMKAYISKPSFVKSKREFRAAAVKAVEITIANVTVYENPVNAPAPGIYMAADYNNVFSGLPIHCGYLVWFKGDDLDDFQIIREESGYVTNLQFEEIVKQDHVAEIKAGLKCVQP